MLRQKQEKSGTGICHVMQGKESKTCPYDSALDICRGPVDHGDGSLIHSKIMGSLHSLIHSISVE